MKSLNWKFIKQIEKELINMGKTKNDAIKLIHEAGVVNYLITNPLGLHDSPHQWALKVLTKANDYKKLKEINKL